MSTTVKKAPASTKAAKTIEAKKAWLAETIDTLYQKRLERFQLQRQCEEMKTEEDQGISAIGEALRELGLDELGGTAGKIVLKPVAVPTIASFEQLCEHISRTGEFDLLQKRLAVSAVNERWQEGKGVPGVKRTDYTETKLLKS